MSVMPNKRQKIGVTFLDLENLNRLLEKQPISIAAAASLLSVQRAYLYRLIERINRIIGAPPPEWRQKKGIILPVEVRRLVRAYRIFAESREDLVRFPRVSAGTRASLLLSAYLAKAGQRAGRLMVVRSRDAVEALRSETIDVALVHESSLGDFDVRAAMSSDLEARRLLRWSSVEVQPRNPQASPVMLAWEPGSLGAALNAFYLESPKEDRAATIFHATSFSHALELARRGIVKRLILPDIYLVESDQRDLIVQQPARPYADHLVILFRSDDLGRLNWLLHLETWRAVGFAAGEPAEGRKPC